MEGLPLLSEFLLPDNGETERGVKTIEDGERLKCNVYAPLRGIYENLKNIKRRKAILKEQNMIAFSPLPFYILRYSSDILSILLSLASQTVTFSSFIQPQAERS